MQRNYDERAECGRGTFTQNTPSPSAPRNVRPSPPPTEGFSVGGERYAISSSRAMLEDRVGSDRTIFLARKASGTRKTARARAEIEASEF